MISRYWGIVLSKAIALLTTVLFTIAITYLPLTTYANHTSNLDYIMLRAYGGSITKLQLINSSLLNIREYLVIKLKYFIKGLGVFRLSIYYENSSTYVPILTYEEFRGVRDELIMYCLSSNMSLSKVYSALISGNDRVLIIKLIRPNTLLISTNYMQLRVRCFIPITSNLKLSLGLRGLSTYAQYSEVKVYEFSLFNGEKYIDLSNLRWLDINFGNANAYAPHIINQQVSSNNDNQLLKIAILTMATVIGVVVTTLIIRRLRSSS